MATAAVAAVSPMPAASAVTHHVSGAHVFIRRHRRTAIRVLSKHKTSEAEKK